MVGAPTALERKDGTGTADGCTAQATAEARVLKMGCALDTLHDQQEERALCTRTRQRAPTFTQPGHEQQDLPQLHSQSQRQVGPHQDHGQNPNASKQFVRATTRTLTLRLAHGRTMVVETRRHGLKWRSALQILPSMGAAVLAGEV